MTEPTTLAQEIAEILRADQLALARIAEVKRRHDARRNGKSDQPLYPVDGTPCE